MPAGKGTEGMYLLYLLINPFSHTSWSLTLFSISSSTCEITLRATLQSWMEKEGTNGQS